MVNSKVLIKRIASSNPTRICEWGYGTLLLSFQNELDQSGKQVNTSNLCNAVPARICQKWIQKGKQINAMMVD